MAILIAVLFLLIFLVLRIGQSAFAFLILAGVLAILIRGARWLSRRTRLFTNVFWEKSRLIAAPVISARQVLAKNQAGNYG